MRKIVSVILVFVLLSMIVVMSVYAETTETEYLYKDRFIEYFRVNDGNKLIGYDEVYYHHVDENDPDSEIDWVCIYAYEEYRRDVNCWLLLDDKKVFAQNDMMAPFAFGYGIYDVNEDKFFDIYEWGNKLNPNISKYDGLEEYIFNNVGMLIGDADYDGELSVLDATFIQMAIVHLCEFSPRDYLGVGGTGCPIEYLSDYDRDGERTVLDATAIQMKLAEIEDTITTE